MSNYSLDATLGVDALVMPRNPVSPGVTVTRRDPDDPTPPSGDLSPAFAKFIVNEDLGYFRTVSSKQISGSLGKRTESALPWVAKPGSPYFIDALKTARTTLRIPAMPVNSLETFYMTQHSRQYVDNSTFEFKYLKQAVEYRNINTYFNSLRQAYDIDDFLSLLILHESAGICLEGAKYGIDPITQLPLNVDLMGYPYPMPKAEFNIPAALSSGPNDWVPYNPTVIQGTWEGKTVYFTVNDKYDPAIAAPFLKDTYVGYNPEAIKLLLVEVTRFRERVMATLLGETFFMLNTARLEDEDTLKTMFQYFDNIKDSIYRSLNKEETIQVVDASGMPIPNGRHSYRIGDINDVKLVMKDPADRTKTTGEISILRALQLQLEACVWLITWNMNKLTGRIAQLQDPTQQLVAEAPVAMTLDPWQNPFLIFDEQASRTRGASTFTNVARAQAVPVTEGKTVTTTLVPLAKMLEAPKVYEQLHRIALPGGKFLNPLESGTDKNKTIAPLLLAAAAAGVIFYLQNK